SAEVHTQLVSDDSEPGALSYMRFGSDGSSRSAGSKPRPPTPAMVGCPNFSPLVAPDFALTECPAAAANVRPAASVTCACFGVEKCWSASPRRDTMLRRAVAEWFELP